MIPSRSCRLTVTELETRDTPASAFLASGAAAGGTPLVEVFRPDGTSLARFEAFETGFRGGVRTAVAELDGNPGTVEVIAAAGPGGAPRVTVWSVDINSGAVAPLASFFAFDPSFAGGVRVAAGNVVPGTPTDEIIVAADTGGGPRVRVFEYNGSTVVPSTGPLSDFFAFEPSFLGGVRVAAGELDGNPADGDELVAGAGLGGGPRVRTFSSAGAVLSDTFALAPTSTAGVNVGVGTAGTLGTLQVDSDPADFSQRNVALNQASANAALQAAAAAGPGAVFGTLFANPSFTTALTNTGLNAAAFFNNGIFSTAAFNANAASFDNAFNSVFGMTALANPTFAGAFNTLNTLLLPTNPFGTLGVASSVVSNFGLATTAFPTGSAAFPTGTTSLTGPFTISTVGGAGSPFSTTVFSPSGPFDPTGMATTTGILSTTGVPVGSMSIVV